MTVAMLLAASIVGYLTFKSIIVNDYVTRLEHDINLLDLRLPQVQDMQRFADRVKAATGLRVTLIAEDGTVIADSDSNASQMENHATRPEVLASTFTKTGTKIRHSDTLGYDLLYAAKKVHKNGQNMTLRLAIGLSQMLEQFWNILTDVLIVFSVFLVFAYFLALRVSRRLQHDVDEVIDYLDAIGDKKYKAVLKVRYYKEFLQIALQLKNVVKRLRQREKQRRKYTAKLRLINQQRADLLSALSHEFKNPIAVIVGYAETLRDDEEAAPQIRKRFLEKILANAQKMTAMVDRLSFSVKLENNDLEMHMDAFDMADVCEDVVSNLSKKYPARTLECDAEPTLVFGDRQMMEIVVTNLVDNALKYSEERVEVELKNGKVSVIDHGVGIPKKDMDNITYKYYRVVKNTWDNSMGLGLSIVSYILKQHHTELDINSERGKGSEFGFSVTPMQRCELSFT